MTLYVTVHLYVRVAEKAGFFLCVPFPKQLTHQILCAQNNHSFTEKYRQCRCRVK